jgi:hypothetical protein
VAQGKCVSGAVCADSNFVEFRCRLSLFTTFPYLRAPKDLMCSRSLLLLRLSLIRFYVFAFVVAVVIVARRHYHHRKTCPSPSPHPLHSPRYLLHLHLPTQIHTSVQRTINRRTGGIARLSISSVGAIIAYLSP